MSWRSSKGNSQTIHEAVDFKSGGRADEFLYGTGKTYRIQNLDVLAQWILHYARSGTKIYVVGDYDVDGVMALAETSVLLEAIGCTNYVLRPPKRMSEGYGFSTKILSDFREGGVILTVDNGIAAHEAIEEAKKNRFVVLVTDHHMPKVIDGKVILPKADLIVDPHADSKAIAKGVLIEDGFDGYCGAGLVYKLAELLIPGTVELDEIAAMAAIATIADVMPLVEDNREIFKRGTAAMKAGRITPGMKKLLDVLRSGGVVSEGDIGFKIAPMLNAPGRLYDDGATLSLKTVLSRDFREADALVRQLNEANEKRKELKAAAVSRALKIVDDECLYGTNPLVIVDEETPEGIVGLVAGELCEKFNVTAIALTASEMPGILKGSGRAASYDDLKKALDAANAKHPGLIAGYGGHSGAAGIRVEKAKVQEFADAMEEFVNPAAPKGNDVEYDVEIEAGELARSAEEAARYAPFGEGNPAISFKVNGFRLVPQGGSFWSTIGRGSIRFFGAGCEAIGFGLAKKFEDMKTPLAIDMVGKLSFHCFNGKRTPQIEITDFRPSESVKKESSDLADSIAALMANNGLC